MLSPAAEIRKICRSSLARNAGWMLVGQGLSFVLQAAYFVLLARLLGVQEYGVFAGAFALVGIAMPYSTLGSGTIFMRYVGARPQAFAAYWGNIILSTAVAGGLLTLLLRLGAPHFLNSASASIILPVALANCVFGQLVANMGQVFQTFELLRITAVLSLMTNALRLVAVGFMTALLPHATAREWAVASVYISMVAAGIGFVVVSRRFGRPKFVPGMVMSNASEGLGFSLGGSAQSVYNDVDKTLLSHYGMNVQNGLYTLAYRVVDIATIPITAIDAAALPRYFRTAVDDLPSIPHLARRLARSAAILGLFMSVAVFLAAPLIPHIVGHGFAQSVRALRWLCLLPAFRGAHQLTGSAVTGMGFQRFRTVAQFSAAGFNLVLNLWLIPKYGWLGAAWASLATDGSLVIANACILYWIHGTVQRAPAQ